MEEGLLRSSRKVILLHSFQVRLIKTLGDLVGQEFYGEYLAKTDPLGADVPNPVSHVAYGYATKMCVLDKKTGRIKKLVAAHDVGKAVNPLKMWIRDSHYDVQAG